MAIKFIRFACPNCQKKLKANRPSEVGKTTRCPFCGCRITVPVPSSNPQAGDGASNRSTIQMDAYQGRENDHLPSQPAKSPLLYALGGAALVLLLGGGMFAAYTIGQGKAEAVAESSRPVDSASISQDTATQPRPIQTSPITQKNEPQETTSKPVTSPPVASPSKSSETATTSTDPSGASQTAEPAPEKPARSDDSNRPTKDPFELIQPLATGKQSAPITPTPVFVEVPVLVPSTYGEFISGSKAVAVPDLSVIISPEDTSAKLMKIDHLSPPGLVTKMTVTLDQTPKTEVSINVTADKGLVLDQSSLTFAAKVAPIQQVISISGDGTADMRLGPSKILYVHVAATGGGLTAGSPAKIPVQVRRRNSFLLSNGLSLNRDDITTSTSPTLSNWTFSITGSPILTGEQYTADYVQLRGPIRRFRFYEDRIEVEQLTSPGTYQSRATGSWQ